jgi:uncharacterized membrane protein YhaH (DUF805 family)
VVYILRDLFLAKGKIDHMKFVIFLMPKIIIGFHFLSDVIKLLILLVIAIIQICLIIKRLHDLNRTGLAALFAFIPIINIGLLSLLAFKKGTDGHNLYGPDPLDDEATRPPFPDYLC